MSQRNRSETIDGIEVMNRKGDINWGIWFAPPSWLTLTPALRKYYTETIAHWRMMSTFMEEVWGEVGSRPSSSLCDAEYVDAVKQRRHVKDSN